MLSHDGAADAVVVEGISRRFGAVPAVADLSFSIARGAVFALLGPNGAGKTTTLKICEGFETADTGSVRVLGADPRREGGRLLPRLGVMLQSGGAHGGARVREALELVARCARNPQPTDELLDVVGLRDVATIPVRRLSGGQAQRLSLAMALVGRPELLFLDEPTAGMDPQMRHHVWDILRAARADGVTIVLTTHLLDEVEVLADDILIIDRGRAVARGGLADIVGGARRVSFTAAAGLDLAPLAARLGPGATIIEHRPGRYRIDGDLPKLAPAAITGLLAEAGIEPTSLTTGTRSLDEAYLELIDGQGRP